MKSVSGRDFARVVERRGWTLLRFSGSHHIYGKSGSVVRLSIPIHGNKPLKRGPAAAFGEARGYFRRRSLAARNPALRVLSSPSLRSCGERAGVRGPSLVNALIAFNTVPRPSP